MLGSSNNCNIIKFISKTILCEDFDDIYKVELDDISENKESLVQTDRYGAINA